MGLFLWPLSGEARSSFQGRWTTVVAAVVIVESGRPNESWRGTAWRSKLRGSDCALGSPSAAVVSQRLVGPAERTLVETTVREGEVLADKYRVERVLGAGGMGYVVACHHIHLQQKVALKFLHPNMLENEEIVGRFLREAQAAVQIKSEHVARVSDVGTLANGVPYMVMEFLEGTDLKHALEAKGHLPVAEAVDYLLQACEALAEAHVLGIVHRDLKPDNLFLTRKADGRASIKVLDFGISKANLASSGASKLTGTSAMLGTPYYMAPEQLTSTRSVDARADIWSLGVVLYELISGTLPFQGETLADLCIRIVQSQPIPLPSLDPVVPVALWNVVARCLEKNFEARYPNVAELCLALVPFGSARAQLSADTISRIIPTQSGVLIPSVIPSAPFPTKARTGTIDANQSSVATGNSAWGRTSATTSPKPIRAALLVGGLASLTVLGAAGWLFASRSSDARLTANSAAGPTSSALIVAAPAANPVPISSNGEHVLVNPAPVTATSPSGPVGSVTSPQPRAPSPAGGPTPGARPSRSAAPEPQKRQGAHRTDPTVSVKPSTENLIEDRR
jgi:eukaryotic-like serine/threonine-protein kinase